MRRTGTETTGRERDEIARDEIARDGAPLLVYSSVRYVSTDEPDDALAIVAPPPSRFRSSASMMALAAASPGILPARAPSVGGSSILTNASPRRVCASLALEVCVRLVLRHNN